VSTDACLHAAEPSTPHWPYPDSRNGLRPGRSFGSSTHDSAGLCTLNLDCSFRPPRWRPPFITKLSMEDPLPPERPGHPGRHAEVRHPPSAPRTNPPPRLGGPPRATGGVIMDVPSRRLHSARGSPCPTPPGGMRTICSSSNRGPAVSPSSIPATGKPQSHHTAAGLHPRRRFLWPLRLHRPLTGSRVGRLQRHPPSTDRLKEEERQCGLWVVDLRTGENGRLPPLRLRRAGNLRHSGPAQSTLPGKSSPKASTTNSWRTPSYWPDEVLKDVAMPRLTEEEESPNWPPMKKAAASLTAGGC